MQQGIDKKIDGGGLVLETDGRIARMAPVLGGNLHEDYHRTVYSGPDDLVNQLAAFAQEQGQPETLVIAYDGYRDPTDRRKLYLPPFETTVSIERLRKRAGARRVHARHASAFEVRGAALIDDAQLIPLPGHKEDDRKPASASLVRGLDTSFVCIGIGQEQIRIGTNRKRYLVAHPLAGRTGVELTLEGFHSHGDLPANRVLSHRGMVEMWHRTGRGAATPNRPFDADPDRVVDIIHKGLSGAPSLGGYGGLSAELRVVRAYERCLARKAADFALTYESEVVYLCGVQERLLEHIVQRPDFRYAFVEKGVQYGYPNPLENVRIFFVKPPSTLVLRGAAAALYKGVATQNDAPVDPEEAPNS